MILGNQLTDKEFNKFSELIYEQTGIFMKPEKKELLNARLGKRLRICGVASFNSYYDFILAPEQQNKEFVHFLDSVSTNFTSFFREISHFEFLTKTVLPELAARHPHNKECFFWSSASSSGEEPYTLAMVLEDFARVKPGFAYKILATDISTRVLGVAAKGVYALSQTTKTPPDILRKYFQKGTGSSAGKVRVKNEVRRSVQFQRFNLMHDFPWNEEMDVIFCRNVMIYFDRETQERLVQKFYRCLSRGGYLFIGHSESISGIKHDFVQVEATTYKKG
nr:protein-glutamate O-methyltransferase [Desulfobulbaceae bacterium]